MAANSRPSRRNGEEQTLSIGALSRATRIPVETLRTWERRYGSPVPIRKPSGHRVYQASAVEHLRRVSRLLEEGHRPGEVLGLSPRELDALLSLTQRGNPALPSGPDTLTPPADVIRALLRATHELDREALLHELGSAWVRLGPARFLDEVAGAFMVEVGRGWHGGTLEVGHEHFASACLSDFLRGAREPFDRGARGARVVAAMLPGELHEGGLLIASTVLAIRGYRVLYLGASTPIDQIVSASTGSHARSVAISVSSAMPRANSAKAIARLRRALPARVQIWTGGAGAPPAIVGVERFESLAALDARLSTEPIRPMSPRP